MDELLKKLQSDQMINVDQVRVVAIEAALSGKSIRDVLIDTEFLSLATLELYRTGPLGIELDIQAFVPDSDAINLFSESAARRHQVLPVSYDKLNSTVLLAVEDPTNVVVRDRISRELASGREANIATEFRCANVTDIIRALDKCYGACHSLQGIMSELEHYQDIAANDPLENTPVVRLVDALLQDAITRRASDIHFSPEQHHIQVRFRVDGVLQVACCLHIKYWSAMLVRIKVLSGLDIAESRMPQDGHLSKHIHGQRVDFRVASFPLAKSENLVLRVLDRQSGLLPLASLCDERKTEQALQKIMQQPDGLVLVCGPTGSGKTTTLYSLLATLDASKLNIMTLEDPVEYAITNIQQTRVQNESAFDFAEGVRAVLRQDPDVILVGEVRDKNSSSMTCRAAMTGHLVLSSIHAESCIGAIARLIDLGTPASVLSTVLKGVVSQRLVRRVCQQCQTQHRKSPQIQKPMQKSVCGMCAGTGYNGRIALFEILPITHELRELMQRDTPLIQIHNQAIAEGMIPLLEMAKQYVRQGQTNSKEIQRVFGAAVDTVAVNTDPENTASVATDTENLATANT